MCCKQVIWTNRQFIGKSLQIRLIQAMKQVLCGGTAVRPLFIGKASHSYYTTQRMPNLLNTQLFSSVIYFMFYCTVNKEICKERPKAVQKNRFLRLLSP